MVNCEGRLRFLSETTGALFRRSEGRQGRASPSETSMTHHHTHHNAQHHTHTLLRTHARTTHGKGRRGRTVYTRARVELVLAGPTCAQWKHLREDGVDGADRGCVDLVLHHVFVEDLLLAQGLLVEKRHIVAKKEQGLKERALQSHQVTDVIVGVDLDGLPDDRLFVAPDGCFVR